MRYFLILLIGAVFGFYIAQYINNKEYKKILSFIQVYTGINNTGSNILGAECISGEIETVTQLNKMGYKIGFICEKNIYEINNLTGYLASGKYDYIFAWLGYSGKMYYKSGHDDIVYDDIYNIEDINRIFYHELFRILEKKYGF